MTIPDARPLQALVVALPETAGSALYGMIDVLAATGNIWQSLVGTEPERTLIRPGIVSTGRAPFRCGNGIPVIPEFGIEDDPPGDIVILPELWLRPDESIAERHPGLMDWLRRAHRRGKTLYSACSGAVLLAESGLLDGKEATSHWGYAELFRRQYPEVRFRPEPSLAFADRTGRIVTAGGTTSWHDLAIHIISRHCGPGEALRIAKTYLLKWHGEGQLPYASLVRRLPHADSAVRASEDWLGRHFREPNAVARAVEALEMPERTLKRRFRAATGSTLIGHVQNLRVEEAKRLLEAGNMPTDDISAEVGYEDPAFFRRLFKRSTGLTMAEYRRMFRPVALAGAVGGDAAGDSPAPDGLGTRA